MSGLTPIQQEIRNRFLTNYKEGGIAACRAMVTDLAAEVAMAVAMSDGADEVKHEVISAQEGMSFEEIVTRIRMLDSVPTAVTEAMSRHSFALFLLRVIEKGMGETTR